LAVIIILQKEGGTLRLIRILEVTLICILIVTLPFLTTYMASLFQVRFSPTLSPGWTNTSFDSNYHNESWSENDFSKGWSINWTIGQSPKSSGFTDSNGMGDLFATFNGSLGGLLIRKAVIVDTAIYPYLIINYSTSTSDPALMFSFGLTDSSGHWHDGGWKHVSNSWNLWAIDLNATYSGPVIALDFRLTNDYNPSFASGKEHTYIESIGFFASPPDWVLSQNKQVYSRILETEGSLNVSASGAIPAGTIVAAQRLRGLDIDSNKYKMLSVSVRASSVNVQARITVWMNKSQGYPVLLNTFNDTFWHNEVIDLSFFNLSGGNIYMIEVGWKQLLDGYNSSVCYRQLSLNSLEGIY
jgi:hypothetical protein